MMKAFVGEQEDFEVDALWNREPMHVTAAYLLMKLLQILGERRKFILEMYVRFHLVSDTTLVALLKL